MVEVMCPGCGNTLLVDEHIENTTIHCGNCQTDFIVKDGESFVVE